jgi:polar amino acid transport system substrate-binding protein
VTGAQVIGAHERASARPAGRRRLGGLVVALAAVVLAACGSSSPGTAASTPAPVVIPKGAQIVHPSAATTGSGDTCNATASLRPPTPMPTPGQMPSGSWMAHIEASDSLKVGIAQNSFPFSYRDPVSGLPSGFDIDMLRQVALAIFGPSNTNPIQFVIVPNADRQQAVRAGEVDLLAETMTINCERETGKEAVDFSTVYYEAGQRILVPTTNSTITGPQDLGGKRVCTFSPNSTSFQHLVAQGMPRNIRLWAVNDITDCLVMLQQGQVDAISTDDAILLGLVAQDPMNTKIVGPVFGGGEPYGMAISKAHPGFTSFVNGVLAQVRADGTWARIYDNDLEPSTHTPAPAPPPASYR